MNFFKRKQSDVQVNNDATREDCQNNKTATNGQPRTLSTSNDEESCVVCFKNVTIYSIGECDHPVCYECSTRMRVLCQQNECPICRQVLAKVIFSNEKLSYRQLEAKNRSEYYNKKYKIAFCTEPIQKAFFQLLDHPCPKCNTPPYRTFQGLRNHVRKEHDLHYCDLCAEHLKIFTFERRCYTPAELGVHRSKGDTDNRSHRGHPLCEYCNKRFLDRDELFRHLRREHFFCHFCEADGVNEFYKDYDSLADHFRKEHFLCEKGRCATEQFVGAFRTEIDYKAHVANVHGESLNKHQAKQTRTLQLEITLGPRGRTGQPEANVRSRATLEEPLDEVVEISSVNIPRPLVIDANNEQDFPSLNGNQGPSVSLARPPPILHRSSQAGLARTKENFPALGGGSEQPRKAKAQNVPPLASVLKKQTVVNQKPNNTRSNNLSPGPPLPPPASGSGMILHMSNRNNHNQAASSKHSVLDFPALTNNKQSAASLSNKKVAAKAMLEEDMGAAVSLPLGNVAAKHRPLVDDYVSVANPANFQKIQMVQKEELERQAKREAERKQAPKLNANNFPSLAGSSKNNANGGWVTLTAENKKNPPLLQVNKKSSKTATTTMGKNEKKQKDKKNEPQAQKQQKQKENRPNESVAPPPGFSSINSDNSKVKPPPGFQSNVTVGSVAKPANNLTFTSSLGESYNILPLHVYMHPENAAARRENLDRMCQETLPTEGALKEFCNVSRMFLDGSCKAPYFYDHCRTSLHDKFDVIFPELLALLPDINKQQALYLEYKQRLNNMSSAERKSLPCMEVCSKCKQVLLSGDVEHHNKLHASNNEFPTLKSGNRSN